MLTTYLHDHPFSYPDRLVIGLFFLLAAWLLLSLTGTFSFLTVGVSLIVFFLICLTGMKSSSAWKFYLSIAVGIPLSLFGFALLRGFFTGDAYAYWLPWGSAIAATGVMPTWLTMIHMPYTSYGPFWPLWIGALFTALPVSEFSVALLPATFFTMGALLVIYWLRQRGFSTPYCFAALVLIGLNSQTAFWSWNLLAESLLFLTTTLFFYYYERLWNEERISNWYFLIAAFALAVMTKFSALLLLLLILIVIVRKWDLIRRSNMGLLSFILLPLLAWSVRGYMLYGNPIFPMLNGFIGGKLSEIYTLSDPFTEWAYQFPTYTSRARLILGQLLVTYPFIILSFFGFFRSKFRTSYGTFFTGVILAGIFIVFSASSGMRYIWPYIGVLAIYAIAAVRDLTSTVHRSIAWFVAVWSLASVPVAFSSSDFINRVESLFYGIGRFAAAVSNFKMKYAILAASVLLICSYFISRRRRVWQYSIILLLGTSLLQVRWIANKSFVNTWSFILLLAIIIVAIAYFERRLSDKLFLWTIGIYFCVLFLANSYAQAAIYYARQGAIEWPQAHVYEQSRVLVPYVQAANLVPNDAVLTLSGSDYFTWFVGVKTMTLNSFAYVLESRGPFTENMTARELYDQLRRANVRLILKNADTYNNHLAERFVSLLDSDTALFSKYCVPDTNQCAWKVNENVE